MGATAACGSQPAKRSRSRAAPSQRSGRARAPVRRGTPLHKAAGTVNQVGVEELIRLHADVNAHNEPVVGW